MLVGHFEHVSILEVFSEYRRSLFRLLRSVFQLYTIEKYHNLPEIDWSNVHQTSRNHSKSPEHNAGKKASDHTLCEEQAANFIAVFEGKILPVSYLLDSQLMLVL